MIDTDALIQRWQDGDDRAAEALDDASLSRFALGWGFAVVSGILPQINTGIAGRETRVPWIDARVPPPAPEPMTTNTESSFRSYRLLMTGSPAASRYHRRRGRCSRHVDRKALRN